jgi:flagellar hook-associated protein 3 FlgL
MKPISAGDLGQTLMLRRQNASLNERLAQLTQELSTGETTNPARHLNGEFRYLADVEHRGRTTQAYETATTEAGGFAAAMQASLERIQAGSEALSSDLLKADHGTGETRSVLARNAGEQLDAVVSALNASYAGRSLFAGNATTGTALVTADDILAAVRAAVGGETTITGITAAVEGWFAAADGFQQVAYQGSDQNLSPFRLSVDDSVQLDLRADAEELRSVMSNIVLATLSAGYASPDLQSGLLKSAGLGLLQNLDGLTAVRADLGFAEARIEEVGAGLASEKASLDYAREALLGIDDYATATKLQDVQFHLEALYAVTARLSGLSLVGYL